MATVIAMALIRLIAIPRVLTLIAASILDVANASLAMQVWRAHSLFSALDRQIDTKLSYQDRSLSIWHARSRTLERRLPYKRMLNQ